MPTNRSAPVARRAVHRIADEVDVDRQGRGLIHLTLDVARDSSGSHSLQNRGVSTAHG